MEITEYGDRYNRDNRSGSVLGYTLGLIGSCMSFLVCAIGAFLFFVLNEFVKVLISATLNEVILEFDIFHHFMSPDDFLNITQSTYTFAYQIGIIILVIMFIGFILSLYGTLSYKKNPTSFACAMMIIGGVISLMTFFVPGFLTLIGGSINLFNLVKNSR